MEIGLFERSGDEFTGTLTTLTIRIAIQFLPVYGAGGALAPSHTLIANGLEIGAAWPKVAGDYSVLNVRIDDPVFPVPLVGRLTERGGGKHVLCWIKPRWRQ